MTLEPGYYIYVGSAFGPGGVRSRVRRHFQKTKHHRWHIDYLREFTAPVAAWYSHNRERLEHRWARDLEQAAEMVGVAGFGCSDCRCRSHLFRTDAAPDLQRFRRLVGPEVDQVRPASGARGK